MILLILLLIVPTFLKQRIYRIQGVLMLSTYIIYISTLYFTYIN
ncbi:putative membrane protein [[Clostridium] sordellii ATCC 9714]|nr:putative membrane protein [[Clostridium] sordellii ATCC 9714] [Paeniclostridium sordellii ATCC 9714]